ncbi:MAG: hypothetical protein RIR12_2257 [Bacteroidota bacterium]|jgi:dTDP-4-dehydrorhamnose reductase
MMNKQRILITGANGFLGNYLCKQLLLHPVTIIATGKGACRLPYEGHTNFTYTSLDFTDKDAVTAIIEKIQPTTIIHAGAMCKPDECEAMKDTAFTINVEGTRNLLVAATDKNIHFVFISTDFIFDGHAGWYTEADKGRPINYYGHTKLAAEQLLHTYKGPSAIVRTVLVYGKPFSGRGNILTVVKDKLEKNEPYFIANDQQRTPTYVDDLAWAIAQIVLLQKIGIWHIAGTDSLTPFQMACKASEFLKLDISLLKSVSSAELKQAAMRPPKTGFDITKAQRELNYSPHSFADGLRLTFGTP